MNSNRLSIEKIDSLNPMIWGKSGWVFLNSIALTYRPEHKERYKLFIQQLPFILPCIKCGQNLVNNLDTLDQALENKQSFMKWLLDVRNSIYIEQNRPIKTLDDNIIEIFHHSKNKNESQNQYDNAIIIILSLMIIGVVCYICTKK